MSDTEPRTRGVLRTIVGVILILAAAPAYLLLIPSSKGWYYGAGAFLRGEI